MDNSRQLLSEGVLRDLSIGGEDSAVIAQKSNARRAEFHRAIFSQFLGKKGTADDRLLTQEVLRHREGAVWDTSRAVR